MEAVAQQGHSDHGAHHEAARGQSPAGPLLKMMGIMVGSPAERRAQAVEMLTAQVGQEDTKSQGQEGDLSHPWLLLVTTALG